MRVKNVKSPVKIDFAFSTGACVQATENEESNVNESGLKKFHIVAYTGQETYPCGAFRGDKVVIDLNGVHPRTKAIPLRVDHSSEMGVGHAENVRVENGNILADGYFSRDTEYARETCASAKKGFPWQVSVGGSANDYHEIEENEEEEINGRIVAGPAIVADDFELLEISFCDVAADGDTSIHLKQGLPMGRKKMKLEDATKVDDEELKEKKECGESSAQDDENVSSEDGSTEEKNDVEHEEETEEIPKEEEEQNESTDCESAEETEEESDEESDEKEEDSEEKDEIDEKDEEESEEVEKDEKKAEATSANRKTPVNQKASVKKTTVKKRATRSAPSELSKSERLRIEAIKLRKDENVAMASKAIAEGWTVEQFNLKLEADKNDRTIFENKAVYMKGKTMNNNSKAIEAAVLMNSFGSGFKAEKFYDESDKNVADALNLADGYRKKIRSLKELVGFAIGEKITNSLDTFDAIQAAYSTTDINRIFTGILNKTLLAGYETVGTDWMKICKISSVNDFKENASYRLDGDLDFKKLVPNEDIEHGTLTEQEFKAQVETYARMIALDRKMMINDDLNALVQIPTLIGKGCAETINKAVWSALLANPNCGDGNAFFSTNHSNFLASTSSDATDLSIASLGLADNLLATQTTPNGETISTPGKYLLVPQALKIQAFNFLNSVFVQQYSTAAVPVNNPFAGAFELIASPYLQQTNLSGYSNKAWYLFRDPAIIPTLEVSFLNGKQVPVVESQDMVFSRLGIQYRAYLDFGVTVMDYRGAVKMKGEA